VRQGGAPLIPAPAAGGLADGEAARLALLGESNAAPRRGSRSTGDILRANLLTPFNAVLGALLVAVLVIGSPQDALFGLVIVANTGIGVIQELRAKRTLDRLSILVQARATVIRDGRPRSIAADEIVLGDLIEARAGDQVHVDGDVVDAAGLEVSEALLTGEAAPLAKRAGDHVLSGSFVVAGRGWYRATRVGEASYASRLAAEARRFQLVRSKLVAGINRILGLITWAMPPLAILLITSQLRAHPQLVDAVRASVAGIVTLVPEGLFLLTSVSMAVAVVRLGRRRILAQQLAAVEMLARVDVVCMDKTGTLTDGAVTFDSMRTLAGDPDAEAALAALARADASPDASIQAVAVALPVPEEWRMEAAVPFSSERRWSGATFTGRGTWVLGAPDALLAGLDGAETARARVARLVGEGHRVLLLARAGRATTDTARLAGVEPAALAVLSERVRPDASATLAYLAGQGLAVKVISGDHPETAAAIARSLGLTAGGRLDVSGRDDAQLDAAADGTTVFGRVRPEQKRTIVQALQRRGHTVAMVGDGVNDVLALKAADVAVAMGAGSAAARAVAHLVLLDGSFAHVPLCVAEGRRVIGNIERLADLFITKTAYAMLLILAVSPAGLPFPFFPRHLTLVGAFTIGIPSVFLALAPNQSRVTGGFVHRVLRYSVPAGIVAGLATFVAYILALREPGVSDMQARTVATMVLAGVGFVVLADLSRPLTWARRALVLLMAAGVALAVAIPAARDFLALEVPPPIVLATGAIVVLLAALALWLVRPGTGVRRLLFG
jgi:magnesium-transporting ATPase (P-type)